MSQENVEIVRAMYEVANAGDKLDANFEVLAPDVEFHVSGAFPDLDQVYRGHEGVAKLNEALNEPWVTLSLDPDRFIDAGSQVLVLSEFHARGRDGLEMRLHLANLWTVQDGQIVRMEAFADQESALAAVGLQKNAQKGNTARAVSLQGSDGRRGIWQSWS
jgi:ketosteroid isomerase-like protein